MHKFINWIITVGGAVSQLAYVFFTGSTNSNLSISGEAYFNRNRSRLRYAWYRFINCLFFFQADHCKWAYDNDLKFARWYIDRDAGRQITSGGLSMTRDNERLVNTLILMVLVFLILLIIN